MLAIFRVAALSLLGLAPALASALPSVQAPGPSLSATWAMSVGENDADFDQVDGIGVDDAGNVASTGIFRGVLDLGAGAWQERGRGDIFVASHNPQGGLRWARHIGSTGGDNAYDLDVDGQGAITVSGAFSGRVDFGGVTLASAGGTDGFLARYNRDGALLWAFRFGGAGNDGGNEVAVTASGEVAQTAMSDGAFAAGAFSYRAGGLSDAYVLRVSTAGQVRWVVPSNGGGLERLRAVAIAQNGTVYAGYDFQGSLLIPGALLLGVAERDGALLQILSSGAIGWALAATGDGDDYVRGLTATSAGGVIVSGMTTGRVVVAGVAFNVSDPGGDDYLLALDRSGRPGWSMILAAPGATVGSEVDGWSGGLLASTVASGEVTAWQGGQAVGRYGARGSRRSMLLAIGPDGALGGAVMGVPTSGSESFGDTVGVSPNGRFGAQALYFGGEATVAGTTMRTPGMRDSAIVAVGLGG